MKKILFAFLMFTLTAPAWCYTVSATILDRDGEPALGVAVVPAEGRATPSNSKEVDKYGKFELEVPDAKYKLKITGGSGLFYKDKIMTAKEINDNSPIKMTPIAQGLDEIVVKGVQIGRDCTSQELKSQDQNAVAGIVLDSKDGIKCKITKCKSGYEPDEKGEKCISTNCDCGKEWNNQEKKCEPWKDTTCTAKNAKSAGRRCVNDKEKCIITECNNEYHLDADKNECIYNRGQSCTSTDPNASSASFHRVKGKLECVVDSCNAGFDLIDGKCVAREIASDEEIAKLEKNAQQMEDKKNSLANRAIGAAGIGATGIGGMMALSALSEQKSDDAAERDMRAYLATFRCDYGTGGNSVAGGTSNIELPGGNDMIGLYTQYATLANDLKVRKTALGIKPGIESEVVIDKAETGLYDDVGTGITGGTYASIARALRDPNGEDAKLWNKQKEKTSSNLKTGAIVAGVGAAGSLAANLAVNSGSNKQDKTDKILDEYKSKRTTVDTNTSNGAVNSPAGQGFQAAALAAATETSTGQSQNETDIVATPSAVPASEAQTVTCNEGEGLIGGKCEKCSDKNLAYDAETKTCLSCGENQGIEEGKCVDKNTPKLQNTNGANEGNTDKGTSSLITDHSLPPAKCEPISIKNRFNGIHQESTRQEFNDELKVVKELCEQNKGTYKEYLRQVEQPSGQPCRVDYLSDLGFDGDIETFIDYYCEFNEPFTDSNTCKKIFYPKNTEKDIYPIPGTKRIFSSSQASTRSDGKYNACNISTNFDWLRGKNTHTLRVHINDKVLPSI